MNGIGQVCLQDWAGLVTDVCGSGLDWSRVSTGVAVIDQDCLEKWAGLVKSVCGSGWDWSRVSARPGRICKTCQQE